MRAAWAVFKKELQETIRDHRTLMVMVVVPVLLYPALLVVSEQLALFLAQVHGRLDRDAADEIPLLAATHRAHALAAKTEQLPGLRLGNLSM